MNRIDRLTGILLQLQSHRGLSSEAIARHWEVSLRTVFRDLAALSEAGVPIVHEDGVGYSLMRGYEVPPVMFSEDEAAALFLSGEVTEQIADESLRLSLRSALTKIRSVLPDERKQYLQRLKATLSVSLKPDSSEKGASCNLLAIQNAVLRRRCLSMCYKSNRSLECTDRLVEPLGTLFYANHWHMIAYCRLRSAFRDFRLDRILQYQVLDAGFEGHKDFSIHQFLKVELEECELVEVCLRIKRQAMDSFKAGLFGAPVEEIPEENDWVQLRLQIHCLDWFGQWLLGFGMGVEVMSPNELRSLMHRSALAISERYRK